MSREYGFVSTTLSLSCATFWRWEPSGGPASVADIRLPRQRPPARACVEQYDLAAAPVTWTELPPRARSAETDSRAEAAGRNSSRVTAYTPAAVRGRAASMRSTPRRMPPLDLQTLTDKVSRLEADARLRSEEAVAQRRKQDEILSTLTSLQVIDATQ